MSQRNDYNFSNFDNYNDGFNNREYRRRSPQNRQTASNRPVYNVNRSNRRPSRRNKRRTRNRIIIVSSFLLIIILLIVLFSIMIRGCSGNRLQAGANVSKETKSTAETTASGAAPNGSQASSDGDLLSPTTFITPNIEDNNKEGFNSFGIYVWNEVGYELFGSDEEKAKNYANTINGFADKFSDNVTVYDMVVPNHTEMGLPQRLKNDEAQSSSQADNIKRSEESVV